MVREEIEQPAEIQAGLYSDADRREQARVEAVRALRLLERPVAEGIEQVVALAAELCRTPNATVNIVDEEWLHSIAAVGGPQGRFPREDIPCDLVVRSGSELIVQNAALTPILADSPVVDGSLAAIGFYASVPLRTVAGHVVGTLCAYDDQPHEFSGEQLRMLRILADHAIGILQLGDALDRARRATEQLARQSGQAQELAQASGNLFEAAFRHATDGMAVLAASGPEAGRIIRANPAVNTITGRSGLVGLTLAEILGGPEVTGDDKRDRRALMEEIDRLISEPAGEIHLDTLEHHIRIPVGTGHTYVQLMVTLTRDDQGRPEHALVQLRDITAQQAHEQWLSRQTQTDSLTGLGNQLAMRERLPEEIAALRGHDGLGVMMIDLDNFKAVNDRLGRPAGDDLLCRMADALVTALPVEAFATRLGGDEFVVITRAPSAAALQEMADAVSLALGETATYFGDRLGVLVGASVGLAYTQNPATDPQEMLTTADSAMYENKRRRRRTEPGAALYAVPSPRGTEPALPAPTPAPRHTPTGPTDTTHPAQSRHGHGW